MPLSGRVNLKVNGKAVTFPLSDLLEGARAEFVRGWLSEAVHVHCAVPEEAQILEGTFSGPDDRPAYYFLRVRQYNEQYARPSPITFRGET